MKSNRIEQPVKESNARRYRLRRGMTTLELLITVTIIALLAALIIGGMMAGLGSMTAAHTKSILGNCQGVLDEIIARGSSLSTQAPNHFFGADDCGVKLKSGEYYWEDVKCSQNDPPQKCRYNDPVWNTDVFAPSDDKDWWIRTDYDPSVIETDTVDINRRCYIERFVWAAMQDKTSREMLTTLGIKKDEDDKGALFNTDRSADPSNPDFYLEVVDGWGKPIIYVKSVSSSNDTDERKIHFGFLPDHPQPYFASAGADGKWGNVHAAKDSQAYQWCMDNLYSFNLEGVGHE